MAADDELVAELAEHLANEVGSFLQRHGGLTAVQIGDALGCFLSVGAEMLKDCPGCQRKYIDTLKEHVADLDAATAETQGEHVH